MVAGVASVLLLLSTSLFAAWCASPLTHGLHSDSEPAWEIAQERADHFDTHHCESAFGLPLVVLPNSGPSAADHPQPDTGLPPGSLTASPGSVTTGTVLVASGPRAPARRHLFLLYHRLLIPLAP